MVVLLQHESLVNPAIPVKVRPFAHVTPFTPRYHCFVFTCTNKNLGKRNSLGQAYCEFFSNRPIRKA